MHRLLTIAVAALALAAVAGCQATTKTEMPTNDQDGADRMRISPCACAPIEYDGSGFKWLS